VRIVIPKVTFAHAQVPDAEFQGVGIGVTLRNVFLKVIPEPIAITTNPGGELPTSPGPENGVKATFQGVGIGVTLRNVFLKVIPEPIAITTNPGGELPTSPGPENGVKATSAELTQAAFASQGVNPPLGSSVEISAPVTDATTQVTGPLAATSLGYSLSSQNSGQSGTQAQGWLLSSPPTPDMVVAPSPSELRSLDPHAILPNFLPPLELGPQGEQEASDPQSLMSVLEVCPRRLLAVSGPQCQKAAPLPPPDLPALEAGLLQFLAELGETSAHLAEIEYGTALPMCLLAAAGAGMACAIAHRQQRRFAGRSEYAIGH
jgi:hypothetical protein